MKTEYPTRRGTSNRDARGSTTARRIRRAWLVKVYESEVAGMARCYRCGHLLMNPDEPYPLTDEPVRFLTIDRILPGCRGGTYRRENIRPACGPCNSETGGSLRSHS